MVQECLKEEAAQEDFKILSCVCLFVSEPYLVLHILLSLV